MPTKTKTPTLAERILADGRIAYVPGGISKYENDSAYGIERPVYQVVELRKDVLVRGDGYSPYCDKVTALIIDAGNRAFGSSGAKPVMARNANESNRYDRYTPTGEWCVPVTALSLHWVEGTRFDAARTSRKERVAAIKRYNNAEAVRKEALTIALGEALGLPLDESPWRHSFESRVRGIETRGEHGSVRFSGKALEALCAKLGVSPECLERSSDEEDGDSDEE